MKRLFAALCLLLLCACAADKPSFVRTGYLPHGATISVNDGGGNIEAYAPERGEPSSQYTIAAYEKKAHARTRLYLSPTLVTACAVHAMRNTVIFSARDHCPRSPARGVRFLVRAPKGSVLLLNTKHGSVNVADVDAIVDVRDGNGDVKMLIPRYGNVWDGHGNVSVIFASTDWPGTLHYADGDGDVKVYVNEHAKARVHLHTADGTIFSDFPLRGTSRGTSETIDGVLNGGAPRGIDIEVTRGSIQLLQLRPQI